jgi:predicted TIM-barrel fold metal-dependent hydrolase
MVIDTHQHVFWHGRDDAGLIADMDEHGVGLAWLLTWECHPMEHPDTYVNVLNPEHIRPDGTHRGIPLEDLIAARNRYPDRFVLGFCPHPLMGDAPARLRAAAGIHGVRVCGEWKFRIPFDDPRCLELYRVAGELRMPVVLHLDVPYLRSEEGKPVYQRNWYGGTVENLERALTACPETIFIGHAPGFWREISSDADSAPGAYPVGPVLAPGKVHALLERHENLYADLSAGSALRALKRDPEQAKLFLEQYSSKLLFARDYYGGDLLDFLRGLELSDASMQAILRANAEKLLAASDQPTPA